MSDFKELVKNLYTSKNRELTPEKFDYIQKTYSNGKEQEFVKNFYATIGEDLTEEKLTYISDTYLKKKDTPSPPSATPSRLPKISEQVSPLQQGANILGGGVIKDISAAVPKKKAPKTINEGVQKDKENKNSIIGGLYNTLVGAVADVAGGVGYMNTSGGVNFVAPEAAELMFRETVNKLRSESSSRENERKLGEFDVTDGVGLKDLAGLAFQAPSTFLSMGMGALTAGTSFFMQSVSQGVQELNENPNSNNLSTLEKTAFLYTTAAATAALEKFGLDKLFKGSGVTKKYVNQITKEVIDEFAKKNIKATAKQIEEAAIKKASQLSQKLLRGGKGVGEAILAEGATEGMQSASGDIIKLATNAVKDKKVFNEIDIADNFFKNITNASVAGGLFGGVAGTLGSGLKNTNKAVREQVSKASTPEELQKVQDELNTQVELGNITPEEAQKANITAQQYAEIAGKIPQEISQEKKYDIIGGIEQREKIKADIEALKADIETIDEAFPEYKQGKLDQVTLLEGKALQVNDYIDSIVNGVKPTYVKEGKKFYKVYADGRQMTKTEIPENHYIAGKIVEEGQKEQAKEKPKEVIQQPIEVSAKPNPIDEQSIAASQKWVKDLYSLPDFTRIQDKNGNVYDIKDSKIRKLTLDKEGNIVDTEIIHTDRDIHKRGSYANPEFFNEGYKVLPEQKIQQEIPDENIQPPIEQPELVEAIRVEQEPEAKEGTKVVTLSGMDENERVKVVEERRKSTKLNDKEILHRDFVDLAQRASKARGNEKRDLQGQIRQKIREVNAKAGEEVYRYDGERVRKKTKSKKKGERFMPISGTSKDFAGRAIKEDAVVLFDRSPEFVQKYEELADSPNITSLQVDSGNGVTMTADQIESALQDIADGIPSVQADNLLNALEEGFNRGYFDLRGDAVGQKRIQAPIEDFIGVQQEEVGQPMDEDELQKYLEEQAELPIEEEEDLNDLINQYEQQPQQIDISGKVQSPNPTSEKRSSPEIQPTKEGKGNGSPKAEVGKQPTGEAKPKQEDVEKVAKKTGISPKNLKDLYDINRKLFGLDRLKSLAAAITMDRMVGVMAKRANISKAEMYSKLNFQKESEQDIPQGVKFQVDAFHGSPYEFDKFSTQKIGIGEGAQAFGWGLYFTDLKSIAKSYADNLSSAKQEELGFFEILDENLDDFDYYANELSYLGVNSRGEKALNELESIANFNKKEAIKFGKSKKTDDISYVKHLNNQIEIASDIIKNAKEYLKSIPKKNIYKVSLHKGKTPDQYTWLEWGKPVKKEFLLSNVLAEIRKIDEKPNSLRDFQRELSSAQDDNYYKQNLLNYSGEDFYKRLSYSIGQKEASLLLLRAGIDGIKYPAESIARGLTSDTARGFNYVVFDENAVSIKEVIKFQKDANKSRGAVMASMDGQATIYALTDPNVSTPVHELAHVFEHYLTPEERQEVIKNTGTQGWTIETSEKFARGFEKYLANGNAPTEGLKKVFQKFKQWLTDIYNGIKDSEIDIELSPKMEEIYAKMLGEDAVKKKQLPPPKTPTTQKEGEEGDGEERRFTKQMLGTESLLPKEKIAETLKYVKQTNALSIEEANKIIDEIGLDEAFALIVSDSEMNGGVRGVLGQMLISRYNNLSQTAKTQKEKEYYWDKTIEVANYVTKVLATEAGRMIQSFSLWGKLTPEALIRSAASDLERQGEFAKKKAASDVNKIGKKLSKANEEAANEVAESLDETLEQADKQKKSKAAEKIKKIQQKRKDIINKYKGKGGITFTSGGITKEGIEFIGEMAKSYIEEGVVNIELLVEKIGEAIKEVSGKDASKEVLEKAKEIAENKLASSDIRLISKGLKDMKVKISEVVKKHFTEVEDVKTTLAEKLVEEAGLEGEEAADLADKIKDAFDRIATRKKAKILQDENERLQRATRKLKGTKEVTAKQLHDDIIRLTNLGGFNNEKLLDLLAAKVGTGQLTKEEGVRLQFLAEKVRQAPEGSPKNDAIQDLLNYQANLKGTTTGELSQAVWYASLLAGYKTHIKNIVANLFSTLTLTGTNIVENPKATREIIGGLFKGWARGIVEARHTLATGKSPIHIIKIEASNVLERKSFKGKYNPMNVLKYVSRAMVAADVFAFQGLKESRSYQLAYAEAAKMKKQNALDESVWRIVNDKLLNTKERKEQAKLIIEAEGLTGNEAKRRMYELMEQSRPEKMQEDSYNYAARGTFNYPPEGVLGALNNTISVALDVPVGGVKPLRFLVPFTRILTNVANMALDYEPITSTRRAVRGKVGFEAFNQFSPTKGTYREMTPEERRTQAVKAAIGFTTLALIYAASKMEDEEGEPIIEITGSGSSDYNKTNALKQRGWKPYSIKIGDTYYSYQLTPLILTLGWIGSLNDFEKYDAKDDSEVLDKMSQTAFRLQDIITDMSFMSSTADIFDNFFDNSKTRGKKIADYLENLGKASVPFMQPYTQLSQTVQTYMGANQKETSKFGYDLIKDIPIARNSLYDKVNVLGEPIKMEKGVGELFVSTKQRSKAWDLLEKNGIFLAPIKRKTVVGYDAEKGLDLPASDQQFYDFSVARGSFIKYGIENLEKTGLPVVEKGVLVTKKWDELSSGKYKKEVDDYLERLAKKATEKAKEEVLFKSKQRVEKSDIEEDLNDEMKDHIEELENKYNRKPKS